jgi:hypothetical protein
MTGALCGWRGLLFTGGRIFGSAGRVSVLFLCVPLFLCVFACTENTGVCMFLGMCIFVRMHVWLLQQSLALLPPPLHLH